MKKWWLYLFFIIFLVNCASAQYSYTGGSSLFGNFNFLEFYFEHPYEIDFFIFLIIFFGLTKSVFKKRFKEQGNIMNVGISFALALAIVLWEHNTGRFLLGYGSVGITILVLLLIFVIGYAFLKFVVKSIFPKK